VSHKLRVRNPAVVRDQASGFALPDDFTGLMIAVPAYGSLIHTACSKSINAATVQLAMLGIPNDVCYLVSESMVTRARDQILAVFMGNPQFSHLIMIDSDVEFPREAPLRLLSDCRFHDMVMCLYPKKKQPIEFPVFWTDHQVKDGIHADTRSGCVEIQAGPAGFFMVTRKAVQKLIDANSDLKYGAGQPFDEHRYALFNPIQEGSTLWSEDITFCLRWRRLGGTVWLNPYFDLTHWVGGVAFKGHTLDLFKTPQENARLAELAQVIRPALDIEGWLTEQQALVLAAAARDTKAGTVVELGSWKGRSTAVLGLACKGERAVVAVGTFRGSASEVGGPHAEAAQNPDGVFPQWQANMAHLGLGDTVEVCRGDLVEVASEWPVGKKIGLLFVDPEHTKEATIAAFRAWESHLLPGATVIFHDANWPSVREAIVELGLSVELLYDMAMWTAPAAEERREAVG
jgi:predicted O-methyltransferase YrrM